MLWNNLSRVVRQCLRYECECEYVYVCMYGSLSLCVSKCVCNGKHWWLVASPPAAVSLSFSLSTRARQTPTLVMQRVRQTSDTNKGTLQQLDHTALVAGNIYAYAVVVVVSTAAIAVAVAVAATGAGKTLCHPITEFHGSPLRQKQQQNRPLKDHRFLVKALLSLSFSFSRSLSLSRFPSSTQIKGRVQPAQSSRAKDSTSLSSRSSRKSAVLSDGQSGLGHVDTCLSAPECSSDG